MITTSHHLLIPSPGSFIWFSASQSLSASSFSDPRPHASCHFYRISSRRCCTAVMETYCTASPVSPHRLQASLKLWRAQWPVTPHPSAHLSVVDRCCIVVRAPRTSVSACTRARMCARESVGQGVRDVHCLPLFTVFIPPQASLANTQKHKHIECVCVSLTANEYFSEKCNENWTKNEKAHHLFSLPQSILYMLRINKLLPFYYQLFLFLALLAFFILLEFPAGIIQGRLSSPGGSLQLSGHISAGNAVNNARGG